MRVLELYSGIGGMHYALIESNLSYQVVAAVDINTTANQVYTHNFPNTALLNKTIEGITLEEFNKLSFDMILMSPPCQPFTRIGLQRDLDDPRTKSFLHIVDLLPRLSKAPLYILLENVKGFEKSAAREYLVKTLRECQYTVQEMMVSPTHVGIPNSRLRYYLMAKRSAQQKSDAQTGQEAPVSFHPTFQNLSPTTDELQELQVPEVRGGNGLSAAVLPGHIRGRCVSQSGPVLRRGESPEAAGPEAPLLHPQRGGQSDGLSSELHLSRVRLYQAAVQTSGEQPERGGGGQTSAAAGDSRAAAQRRRTPLSPLMVPALHSQASGPVQPPMSCDR
ncbi:tRNA (cytosine(38)-C(5))-methyltransferase-like isoform X5 [Takifugu rubripes]|uniref:tRNA (cytosine(38)-C(5))-methyltransferase-like isoform X5 n=1 Tax=Takifugu rubripes TaxID=31033 RepID=UPI001145CA38|nr:tRNA (cytosine(38)-C(5))-methyltransferase-like isoform X5 [Takifugu rubripes]